jgi:hypothetical protein
MLKRIDGWASQYPGMTRSAAMRILINAGLRAAKKGSVYDPKDLRRFDRGRGGKKPTISASAVRAEVEALPAPVTSPDGVYSAREKRTGFSSRESLQAAVERAEARARSKK